MKAPERLQYRSDLAGRLVRAGKSERTPEATRRRVLATAATLTITTTASKVAATALGALLRGATVRWIATSVRVVGAGVTTTVIARKASEQPAPPAMTAQTMTAPTMTSAPLPATTEPAPVETRAEEPAPVTTTETAEPPRTAKPPEPARTATHGAASARPEPPAVATTSAAPQAPEPSTLGREVAVLDEARRAMDGNPAAALAVLDRYDATFGGNGHLSDEATVLRIKALARRGDRASARTMLDTFARKRPNSPHLANLRAVVDGPPNGPL
jgi:outer membrane biosynthesis protein TonB